MSDVHLRVPITQYQSMLGVVGHHFLVLHESRTGLMSGSSYALRN